MKRIFSIKHINCLLWLSLALTIAGYAYFFTQLSILKYLSFFSFCPDDLAISNNILWHSSRGNLFFQSITESLFDVRFQPFYLVLGLIYKIYPNVVTLFALEHLALALGAWPIYLITKRQFGARVVALIFSLSYLTSNLLHQISFVDQKPLISFAITFVLFSFYCFEQKKILPFVLFGLLAMSCRDEASFIICMFGCYACTKQMSLRWKITPVVFGLAYFMCTWLLIMPNLGYSLDNNPYTWNLFTSNQAGYSFSKRFFISKHLIYAKKIFISPLFIFSLFAPEVLLIGLPSIIAIQLSVEKYFVSLESMHHSAFLVPAIFLASVYGLWRIANWIYRARVISQRLSRQRLFTLVSGLFFAYQCLSNFGQNILLPPGGIERGLEIADHSFIRTRNMYDHIFYKQEQKDKLAWEFIAFIPEQSSVATTTTYLPALSARDRIYHFGTVRDIHQRSGHDLEVDYVFLNKKNDYLGFGGRELRHRQIIEKIPVLLNSGYIVIKEDKEFILLKKTINE
ncbi:DUF2079 domain-containing protein [Candidatus Omnitrophota bacterium]